MVLATRLCVCECIGTLYGYIITVKDCALLKKLSALVTQYVTSNFLKLLNIVKCCLIVITNNNHVVSYPVMYGNRLFNILVFQPERT